MVATSSTLRYGRRHVGDEAVRVASPEASPAPATIKDSLLPPEPEPPAAPVAAAAFVSVISSVWMMIGMSGGEDTVGGGAVGVGDGGRGAAAFAFGTGSGVAGVVLRLGMVRTGCDSSFVGGGGSMPWPGCGFIATGRATEISSWGEVAEPDATGAGAFRLITFGGELTPETNGSGSSLCTTVVEDAGADGGGEDGSGGGVDSPSISS